MTLNSGSGQRLPWFGVCSLLLLLLVGLPTASANEVMEDACSGEVFIPKRYDDAPIKDHWHGWVLQRDRHGYTPWLTVQVWPNSEGRIRWWCHSTTGNWADPGTWRVYGNGVDVSAACTGSVSGNAQGRAQGNAQGGSSNGGVSDAALSAIGTATGFAQGSCHGKVSGKWRITTFDVNGWTAERSRCKNRSGNLRVRLGPNRQLQMECLDP